MALIKYLRKLKENQYFNEVRTKKSIILHHTESSNAAGAIDWWNQTPERVGTALLVERDGQCVQCFEINTWAYHLGTATKNKDLDKDSIGIELCSLGFVVPEAVDASKADKDKTYYAYPNWPLKAGRVKIPFSEVVKLDKPFKGFQYWHKYTDAQVATTIKVMRYLVDRFKIKVQANLEKFNDYDLSVASENKPGIWSHNTVRKDKWDIFPQPNLIDGIIKEFGTKK